MDQYNIPNDNGVNTRRKTVLQMLHPVNGYIDGATDYCLLVPFAEDHQLNTEQRLWLAYLYALSYSCTTAMRLYLKFPDVRSIKPSDLKSYWTKNKTNLWFNPDKKYIKNNDQVVPAIKSMYKWCSNAFWVDELMKGFDHMYKVIRHNWRFFGPHGAYLFFDAVYGLCPDLYTDPTALDWKNCGKTVREGMAHMLYADEVIQSGDHDYQKYNKIVNKLVDKSGQPKVIVESILCAYRKLFKQTRYHGYYADRMLLECKSTEKELSLLGIDVWDYRVRSIPKSMLGELNGWGGIRKDLMSHYVRTGELDA